MHILLWIAGAGALGSVARWTVAVAVQRACGDAFPWGTLVVNLLGCFLFGVLWVVGSERQALAPDARAAVLVGFLGAFTTFSTFAFEGAELLRAGRWMALVANVVAQNVLGVIGVLLGAAAARAI